VARQLCCPWCGSDMRGASLLSHLTLKPYRTCPDCNAKYTSDPNSRKRQLPIAILCLLVLGLSLAVGAKGSGWLVPAVLSYITLGAYLYYSLSRIGYVKYRN